MDQFMVNINNVIGWNWDLISQVIIFILGGFAVFMTQTDNHTTRKWACIAGLLGQPFWFYTSYMNEQWGIFLMSFFYTFAWFRGYKMYWMTK